MAKGCGHYIVQRMIRGKMPQPPRPHLPRYMNRILVILGTVILVIGLLWPWVRRLPLFRLPGDVIIDRPGFKFFFPITTMLIVSVVISVLAWLFRR